MDKQGLSDFLGQEKQHQQKRAVEFRVAHEKERNICKKTKKDIFLLHMQCIIKLIDTIKSSLRKHQIRFIL